jgi:SAM-dependent methyltransferase
VRGNQTFETQVGATQYDSVIYPGYTHPQTHPERLAVIGTLFGLEPSRVDKCRVLELGCGDGSNLVPMAWGLPDSEFVGLDLAAKPVARGQQMIGELGLRNVELRQGDITGVNGDWGKFDYIIAHGVYSWVPRQVQEHLLATCRRLLAPQGIAFVSYNALPGGHMRNMLRDMMLFHVRDFKSSDERTGQALALARFLAEAQDKPDEYRLWMKAELERMIAHNPGHLYHDELAECNEPLYFIQFMQRAARHELQYLGEADYFEMCDHTFKEPARQTLEKLAPNRVLREQYLDFLKCRRFRQTLLCHREPELRREAQAGKVAGFLVSSSAGCANGAADLRPGVTCTFETPKGGRLETDLPSGKAALAVLESSWPVPLSFEKLQMQVRARLQQERIEGEEDAMSHEKLCGFLLQLYGAGVVDFRCTLPPIARTVTERPVAYPVARWQAQNGDVVTSLFHIAVQIEDEIGRSLMSWLDGTADRQSLVDKIWSFLETKNALVIKNGDRAATRHDIEQGLEKNLGKLARLGLLIQ